MKITRTAEVGRALHAAALKAKAECKNCPGCGRENFSYSYSREVKGLWNRTYYRTDYYSCPMCGCQYQTDPYPVDYEKGFPSF